MSPHVRKQRTQREMSQGDLAQALGVSRQTVISIESGRHLPSLPLAFAIARFFGLTVDKNVRPRPLGREAGQDFRVRRFPRKIR